MTKTTFKRTLEWLVTCELNGYCTEGLHSKQNVGDHFMCHRYNGCFIWGTNHTVRFSVSGRQGCPWFKLQPTQDTVGGAVCETAHWTETKNLLGRILVLSRLCKACDPTPSPSASLPSYQQCKLFLRVCWQLLAPMPGAQNQWYHMLGSVTASRQEAAPRAMHFCSGSRVTGTVRSHRRTSSGIRVRVTLHWAALKTVWFTALFSPCG